MFRSLYESFQDTNPNIQELNANIVRYQSVEPNFTVLNNENNYSFPNAGIDAQQQQAANTGLQNALNSLDTVAIPGSTTGAQQPTTIQNLGNVYTGITDSIGLNMDECRKYVGLTGLSNLMKSQVDPSALQRCGWRYQKGSGVIPTVAQAAYGTRSGPLDPSQPRVDRIGNGINYFWDLQAAEKQMVNDVCKSATNCLDMTAVPLSAAGDFSNLCGYCETSKKIIPIKSVNGITVPRYNDLDSQCAPEKIITMKDAKTRCEPPAPGSPQAPYHKCLNADKLDRDCITMSALYAGCSPQGTLIKALTEGKNDQDYANLLRNQKSFQTYQQLSQTPLSEDVIRSGNATIFAAFMNNYAVNQNMYNSDNVKRWVAALDLCRYGGLYEQWNFCNDLKDGDRDFEMKCMQQYFLRSGGTTRGSDYPNEQNFQQLKGSLTWGQYKASVDKLKQNAASTDILVQSDALNRFSGLNIQFSPTALARGEASQGVEVFYFDTARATFLGRRPYQSAAGQNIPNFNAGNGDIDRTGLRDNIQMVYIFDLRPDTDTQMAFGAVTDDGWAIAKNQSVFNIRDTGNGASWWYNQGPTWHNTTAFSIAAEDRKIPNIMMGAWYEAAGGAVFHTFYKIGSAAFNRSGQPGWVEINQNGRPLDTFWKNNCYFTQEIDAPTLQFEPYQPRNYFSSGLHFIDRRLWGTSQLRERDSTKTATQLGYQFSIPRNTQLPANQMIFTLGNTQQWSITGSIAGSAIRTWVICFNIQSFKKGSSSFCELFSMSPSAGGKRGFSIRVYDIGRTDAVELSLVYTGYQGTRETRRTRIPTNLWYIAAIRLHPENLSSRSISKMSFFVQSLSNVKQGKILDGTRLEEISPGNEIRLFSDISIDRRDACNMTLGRVHANEQKRFHYAWVHGFDNILEISDIDSWKKEVTKSWQGRWFE